MNEVSAPTLEHRAQKALGLVNAKEQQAQRDAEAKAALEAQEKADQERRDREAAERAEAAQRAAEAAEAAIQAATAREVMQEAMDLLADAGLSMHEKHRRRGAHTPSHTEGRCTASSPQRCDASGSQSVQPPHPPAGGRNDMPSMIPTQSASASACSSPH